MTFAVVVEVDNSGEDPEEGRRRLPLELAPAVRALPGLQSLLFLTALERGLGYGVMVFEERAQAEQLAARLTLGSSPVEGVTFKRTDVLDAEVSASAGRSEGMRLDRDRVTG